MSKKNFCISIVNYYCEREVLCLLKLLSRFEKYIQEINIIDNGTNVGIDFKNICSKYNLCIYHFPKKNLGYLNGALFPYEKKSLNDVEDAIYIILNPDISQIDSSFFEKLQNIYLSHNGLVAPKIIDYYNGYNQNPFLTLKPKKISVYIKAQIAKNEFTYNIYTKLSFLCRKLLYKNINIHNSQIYAGHGSVIIFSKAIILELLVTKWTGFLYGEEFYIAEIARKKNFKWIYCDDLVVHHKSHCTTKKISKREQPNWARISMVKIFNDYYRK